MTRVGSETNAARRFSDLRVVDLVWFVDLLPLPISRALGSPAAAAPSSLAPRSLISCCALVSCAHTHCCYNCALGHQP